MQAPCTRLVSVKRITEKLMSILVMQSLCRSSNLSKKYAPFKWPKKYPLVALWQEPSILSNVSIIPVIINVIFRWSAFSKISMFQSDFLLELLVNSLFDIREVYSHFNFIAKAFMSRTLISKTHVCSVTCIYSKYFTMHLIKQPPSTDAKGKVLERLHMNVLFQLVAAAPG